MIIPFAIQSYRSKSLPLSAQRCVNMYAELQPERASAKSQTPLFGVPGLVLFATCGNGPIRGMHVMNSVLYVVSGGTLYSVNSAGTATSLGATITGTGMVSMSDNGTQLIIVNGSTGYVYSVDAGFQFVSSINFHAANTVTFFDNFFVLDWAGTNKFYISGVLDGTSYNALDFASAEVQSDFVLATVNQQENLLIFGQRTIETWYDSGDVSFPFFRYDGATIERGCAAALSIVKEDNSVFFLGDDRNYYRLNGVIPVRISTHAIESAWRDYISVEDAYAFTISWKGHKWIVLNFRQAGATWVYDIATDLWHERVSWDSNNNSLGMWRGTCAVNCYNKVLIGDQYSGRIGYLSDDTYDEYGNTIQAELIAPVLHSDRKRVFLRRFELDVEQGVGINTGQGSDPQIMFDLSRDGGRTFTGPQIWNSMGAIGAYQQRLRWLRLGQSRNFVARITISDPVRRTIIANNADIAVGTS